MSRQIATVREAAGLETVTLVFEGAGPGLFGDGHSPAIDPDNLEASTATAKAQAEIWPALLDFFDTHLR